MTRTMFEVGGCVRDSVLGVRTKDIDFAVEMEGSFSGAGAAFELLCLDLADEGFEIFEVRPEFFTVRAMFPKGREIVPGVRVADFVMCRKDGPSSDGRRPDFVAVGSLADDLARRDFTMNAIARDPESGRLIDPHGGLVDIEARVIRFVGDPMTRLREDGLRALRALRFAVTKGFTFAPETLEALVSDEVPALLAGVSKERMRDELDKMFARDTLASLDLLCHVMPGEFLGVLFASGLRLKPTMEK